MIEAGVCNGEGMAKKSFVVDPECSCLKVHGPQPESGQVHWDIS